MMPFQQITSVYVRLCELYAHHGYKVRTGLYPPHFWNFDGAGGTVLEKGASKMRTGGGIGMGEVYFIEELCRIVDPASVFIIGNAFGWSTFTFALSAKDARVVALDAGSEGRDNMEGIRLTNEMAERHGIKAKCIFGHSPQDVEKVLNEHLPNAPAIVFIDGLHTNSQLMDDFMACHAASPSAVFLFHDIVNCHMQKAFGAISETLSATHKSSILWRTYSGMGISVPNALAVKYERLLNCYSDDDQYIKMIRQRWMWLCVLRKLGPLGRVFHTR
jgi:hypothetical protein